MIEVPEDLRRRPFTSAEAAARGLSWKVLQGRRFTRVLPDVYVWAGLALTLAVRLRAALLKLPSDAVVSGVSAARLWGFDPLGHRELHFSTRVDTRIDTRSTTDVRLHRHVHPIERVEVDGLPVTSAARTVVDCARVLGMVQLVQLIDHLLHVGALRLDDLHVFCWTRPHHGVRRARRALRLAARGAESPRETLLRLMIVFARLPPPRTNVEIRDAAGRFVARVDLLLEQYGVVVEYDGRHHETDRRQWQRDRVRREELEALGYRVIVVTALDLGTPVEVVRRVHRAVVARGHRGVLVTNVVWHRWFPAS
jgi:very-short-patch-repair endonuclease